MSNRYDLEGITNELRKELCQARALLEAWEKVTFPTKKDGSPFKNMSKNINGASYAQIGYASQPGEYGISVSTWSNGYVSDEIKAYDLVKYLKDEAKKAKTQNYQPKVSYLEQVYTYDLDDIKQAVADRIEGIKANISRLEREIDNAEAAYIAFRDAYTAALSKLAQTAGRSTLYIAVRDTVTAQYR